MYADYAFYLAGFLHRETGLIPEEEFDGYSERAGVEMDYRTMGRIRGGLAGSDAVKKCCCELAEAMYEYGQAVANGGGAPLASWSNDGESGSYDLSASDLTPESHAGRLSGICRKYLLRLGVLCRRC